MPSDYSPGREQRRIVISVIQGLVCRAGFPVPENAEDGLPLMEHRFPDRIIVLGLRWVLTNE